MEKSPEMIQTIRAMLTDPVYFRTPETRDVKLVTLLDVTNCCKSYRLDSQKCRNLFGWRDGIWIFIISLIYDYELNEKNATWVALRNSQHFTYDGTDDDGDSIQQAHLGL